MIDAVLKQLDTNRDQRIERLCEYLRIESIGTDSAYDAQTRTAADWTAEQLRTAGLTVEVHDTPRNPIVLAQSTNTPDGAPHVLFYGHYDVQPPDPVDKWTTPPFEPTLRDTPDGAPAIYARGSSDDKGQVMCFIEAVRAWHKVHGDSPLPIHLIVLIEGEEESGSTNLEAFVESHRDELSADIAVVSDSSMWDNGTPAITYALRGLLYFDIKLIGPGRDLHSGVYGGTIANPANELVKVLGKLLDDNHHVTIPSFYDDVDTPGDDELQQWRALGFDDQKWAASVGASAVHGEHGFDTLQRRWSRPSCDINGLYGGYMGEGAKTVIASYVGAKVSFRLAPRQSAARIAQLFEQWLHDHTPTGCRWEIQEWGRAEPVIVSTDSPYLDAARRAMTIGCDAEPVLVREGATIPVIGTFKQSLGIDTLLMGFGKNDDAIHSPNEKFELACFDMGCRSHAALIDQLRRLKP
jgi:acetylornithine deacetylase/succinyl-diaminopimelate desuccinylase-like protein